MPGFLVQQGATVNCLHAGGAQPVIVNPRVLVSGQPTVGLSGQWLIAGCTLPPPAAANGPCVSAVWTSGTTRVLSLGQPLVIQGGTATCLPTGLPLLATATQTRVSAI
jgi:hypothetical protein